MILLTETKKIREVKCIIAISENPDPPSIMISMITSQNLMLNDYLKH